MASASPIATLRLSANIDTSVTNVIARSTAIDPRIANPPTASGSAAASRPPNTQTSTRKLSGIAMDSISSRSFSVWPLICDVDHRLAAGADGDAVAVVHQPRR